MNDMEVIHGDCLEVLPTLEANSCDSVVTDPPYALTSSKRGGSGEKSLNLDHPAGRSRITTGGGFMGKKWDSSLPGIEHWQAILRVLKPGGYMLCFGGTRTYHRLACAVEDAGFEIRDCIMWIFGSGFPKAKSCLKPAYEPILLCRKPGPKMLPLGIDSCRVEATGESRERFDEDSQNSRYTQNGGTNFAAKPGVRGGNPLGRWPANLIHDGSEEVLSLFPETKSGAMKRTVDAYDGESVTGLLRGRSGPDNQHGDSGSAARFFYCAKASKADRGNGNLHPTVKPTSLMRWLCRLITPEGGLILDPFCGSGSTGKSASLEGFRFIGIEREAEYVEIARQRVVQSKPAEATLFG